MVVYNKTVLEKEEVFSSLVKITRRSQFSKFILSSVILLCGLLLLIYGYMQNESNYIGIGYVFFVFSIAYYGLAVFAVIRAPKRVYKQNQEACDAGMIYEYTFKEQSFQVKVISDTKTTKIPYKLSLIHI